MITKEHLETETKKFFDLHWGSSPQIPTWDFSWNWCNAVPNHELGGVYALFSGDALVYIGLGASIGGGIYKNRGIRTSHDRTARLALANSSVRTFSPNQITPGRIRP